MFVKFVTKEIKMKQLSNVFNVSNHIINHGNFINIIRYSLGDTIENPFICENCQYLKTSL